MTAANRISSYESTPPIGSKFDWTVNIDGKEFMVKIIADGSHYGKLQTMAAQVAKAVSDTGVRVLSVDVEGIG